MYGHVKTQDRETFRDATWQHVVEEIRKWPGEDERKVKLIAESITIYRRRFASFSTEKK
jgi:hypothetical protein